MSKVIRWIDKKLYGGYADNWDDLIFRERILAHLEPHHSVLDLGAGAGIVEAMNFRGLAARICGIDMDPRVESNSMLDEGKVADAGQIPYPDRSFDLVFSDNVMEHLADPERVFLEISRILKPGGLLLFKTPNTNHYMPIIARLTPYRFHQYINRIRGRQAMDTFPTRYKANSLRVIERLADRAGMTAQQILRIEGRPEYMRITWPTYLVGALYERAVNSTDYFACLRILLIAELQKLPS